jgi:hypothetical protein
MTLTTHDLFHKGVNLSFSIKNMLNNTYYDPTPELSADTWQTTIVGDFRIPDECMFSNSGTHLTPTHENIAPEQTQRWSLDRYHAEVRVWNRDFVILMPAIQGWPAELFAEREITIAIVQPQNVEAYQEAVKDFSQH